MIWKIKILWNVIILLQLAIQRISQIYLEKISTIATRFRLFIQIQGPLEILYKIYEYLTFKIPKLIWNAEILRFRNYVITRIFIVSQTGSH